MASVETYVKRLQKSMGIPLDQAVYCSYYVSTPCYTPFYLKKGENGPEVNVVALHTGLM